MLLLTYSPNDSYRAVTRFDVPIIFGEISGKALIVAKLNELKLLKHGDDDGR